MRRCVPLAVLVLVAGCSADWSDVRVEHRTGAAPADMPTDTPGTGPAPGIAEEHWRVDGIEVSEDPRRAESDFWVESGNLIVFGPSGVRAYGAADGAAGWSYVEPGRTVLGHVTDGVVVLGSTDAADSVGGDMDAGMDADIDNDPVRRLVGLDAATGKLLWERNNEWRVGELPPADGVLPALPPDPHESGTLTGLDVHTGQTKWTTEFSECGISSLDRLAYSDGSLVLVGGGCAVGYRWDAFDPATGEQLWTQEWDSSTPGIRAGGLTVVDGTTVSNRGEELVRIDRDGTAHAPVPVGSGAQHVYYQVKQAAPKLSLVDLRTGDVAVRGWPSLLGESAVVDDRMYYLNPRGIDEWLPRLVLGDLATGEFTGLPLPGSVTVPAHPLWLGTAGDELLIAERAEDGTATVTAIGTTPTDGPVELGGVPQRKWPKPCALLARAPLDRAPGKPDRTEPAVVVEERGLVRMPRTQCVRHLPGGDRAPLRVPWVAATTEQASGRLGDAPGPDGPEGVDEIADVPTGMAGARVARIGTVFVEVWAEDQRTVTRVLTAVARHLRE